MNAFFYFVIPTEDFSPSGGICFSQITIFADDRTPKL
jgi:hypothetical protein